MFYLPYIYLFVNIFIFFTYNTYFTLLKKSGFPSLFQFNFYFGFYVLFLFFLLMVYDFLIFDISILELLLPFFILLFLISVYNYHYIILNRASSFELILLLLLFSFFIQFLFLSDSLFFIFMILESLNFIFYFLFLVVCFNATTLQATIKYFFFNTIASLFFILGYGGIVFIYGVDSISFISLFNYSLFFESNSISTVFQILPLSFLSYFLFIAMMFKLYSVPFQYFIPDVYEQVPTSIVLFFIFLPPTPFLFLFIKLYTSIFYFLLFDTHLLLVIAILNIFIGSFGLVSQYHFHRFVAFASISATGYFFLMFDPYYEISIMFAFVFYIIYLLSTFLFFTIILNLIRTTNYSIPLFFTSLRSLFDSNRLLGYLISVSFFSLIGLPSSLFFFSKAYFFIQVFSSFFYFIVVFLYISTLINVYIYIKFIRNLVFPADANVSCFHYHFPNFFICWYILVIFLILHGLLFLYPYYIILFI